VSTHLEPWQEEDEPLLHRLLGDPAMMEHLGGPETPEKIAERQQRYLRGTVEEPCFRIVDGGEAVGWIGFWITEFEGEGIYETGWSVVPEAQGRGVAGRATALGLDYIRAHGSQASVHAFPEVTNAASNAICRKAGFELVGAKDLEYPPGHPMVCNDWRVLLRGA
jgi:RimJ/RimL family protein N-acetyltransferase